jgi:hypothetical protein
MVSHAAVVIIYKSTDMRDHNELIRLPYIYRQDSTAQCWLRPYTSPTLSTHNYSNDAAAVVIILYSGRKAREYSATDTSYCVRREAFMWAWLSMTHPTSKNVQLLKRKCERPGQTRLI